MPSTELWPQSEDRDIGLGVTFFSHPYRSDTDYKIYHRHTHLPTLGYCPGCSTKAYLNLRSSASSSSPSQSSSRASITPTTISLYEITDDHELYPDEEDGVLVNAETHHSGPSYTSSNSPVPESESKRIDLVAYMLDMWATADAKKKEQQKKEQQKKIMAEGQEQEWHEQTVRRKAMSRQLDLGSEYGFVKTVRPREQEPGGDSHMMDFQETTFPAGGFSLSSPLGITPTMQQYSIKRSIQTDRNGQAVETIEGRKPATKRSGFPRRGLSHPKHNNDEKKSQLKKKSSGVSLGLVAYGNGMNGYQKQSNGRDHGLVGYDKNSDVDDDVIVID
jgi:hypothetical protein